MHLEEEAKSVLIPSDQSHSSGYCLFLRLCAATDVYLAYLQIESPAVMTDL